MPSNDDNATVKPGLNEIDLFLEAHGLAATLGEPLSELVRRLAGAPPSALFESSEGESGSLSTLVLLPRDERAPDTLPSLVDRPPRPASTTPTATPEAVPLERTALLGRGGMAEVHRARDAPLNRQIAMKVLHTRFRDDPRMRALFIAEAQVTAQLAHPGIPPVHAIGEDRGLPYFSMKEVHGRVLTDVIAEVHGSPAQSTWTVGRLIEVFQKICEAVAYAHSRGVIHCDLKPSNIMVGSFGEVMVMDWGVSRLVAPGRRELEREGAVGLAWPAEGNLTEGVAGTPAYMAPEQALGELSLLGPTADVYALGVVLFEILAGERPYRGNPIELTIQASLGKIPPIRPPSGFVPDEALEAIVHRALAPNHADRYPNASALAADISRWREGSLRREKALAVAREAQALLPAVRPRRERARLLRDLAQQRLTLLGPEATADEKAAAWGLEDEAAALEREAQLRVLDVAQRLHGALAHAPDLREAHDLLARMHLEAHEEAETRRDLDAAARAEVLLRAHDAGDHAAYLAGVSAFSLHTEPPCQVTLHRYVAKGRQLVPQRIGSLGTTPLDGVELSVGSYLLALEAEGHASVAYPVLLRRSEAWTGRPPGAREVTPVVLPPAGALASNEVFVAPGWALLGGDPQAPNALRGQRVWVDGFAIERDPVTAAELYRFLASDWPGAVASRRGVLRAHGGVLQPDAPATGVPWAAAAAYAAWRAATTGLPWRLPIEVEWEKAARGADGRWYPWGDPIDASFTNARVGASSPGGTRVTGAMTHDLSPYGVRGLAGNVRDWCADPWTPEGPPSLASGRGQPIPAEPPATHRAVRGGSWRLPADAARAAARAGLPAEFGYADVGFRLVRSLGTEAICP